MVKDYRMALTISFVLKLKGAERIDGYVFMVMSFLYLYHGGMQTNWIIHGEKWMIMGSDGMVEMISLRFIYTYVFLVS